MKKILFPMTLLLMVLLIAGCVVNPPSDSAGTS